MWMGLCEAPLEGQAALGMTAKSLMGCRSLLQNKQFPHCVRLKLSRPNRSSHSRVSDPVELNGTTVSRATCTTMIRLSDFNSAWETRCWWKRGRNHPKNRGCAPAAPVSESRPIDPPIACPACDSLAIQYLDEIDWRCPNPECPAQLQERLLHFVSRRAMDIDAVGPALLDQLLKHRLVRSAADLYRLQIEDLTPLERMGLKSAHVMLAIDQSRQRPPSLFARARYPHV